MKIIYRVLYEYIGKNLPLSYRVGGKIAKRVRYALVSRFICECGKNINFEKGAFISSKLSIGDNSGIGQNAVISGPVSIGCNVMMGPDCIVYTRNHSFDKLDVPMIHQGYKKDKKVIIDDDVWIGGRVIILPGRTIGKGAVIGAGTVVSKDVPEYAIVAGNPGKIVGYRNK